MHLLHYHHYVSFTLFTLHQVLGSSKKQILVSLHDYALLTKHMKSADRKLNLYSVKYDRNK